MQKSSLFHRILTPPKNFELLAYLAVPKTSIFQKLTVMDCASSPPRAWAEIDLAALKHNLDVAKSISDCQVMAVLKAGAYGHGLEKIAAFLDSEKLPYFGVANVGEARRLKDIGIQTKPYLLGATFAEEREEIVLNEWTPCISTLEEAQHFSSLAEKHHKKFPIHLAIDTGMGRGGFLPSESIEAAKAISCLSNLNIIGIGSHMPSPDEDPEFTQKQIQAFADIVQELRQIISPQFIHLSNSAGLLGYQQKACNMLRPGLMLYGISPLPEFQSKLKPVMALKSRITLIRDIPEGHGVSYGRTFITKRPSKIATVGIGYGDGFPRSLSGQNTQVSLHGKMTPLIGRVTMDQIMIDVTDFKNAQLGDEVELFGSEILASDIAEKAGTIPWELFTNITPRVTRVYK